jgi:predicted transporter
VDEVQILANDQNYILLLNIVIVRKQLLVRLDVCMKNFTSRSEKELWESSEKFASKKLVFFIYTPCFIALGFAILCAIIDSSTAPYAIVLASMLPLVCNSIDFLRKKIIQQDKTIQLLQEKLDQVSGSSD